MINRLYKAYDKLPEPKRFLAFFIPASLLLFGTSASNMYVAAICWSILIIGLVTRVYYIHR